MDSAGRGSAHSAHAACEQLPLQTRTPVQNVCATVATTPRTQEVAGTRSRRSVVGMSMKASYIVLSFVLGIKEHTPKMTGTACEEQDDEGAMMERRSSEQVEDSRETFRQWTSTSSDGQTVAAKLGERKVTD